MKNNELTKVFTFNPANQIIRIEIIENEPWFVAKDVCDALELKDVEVSLRKLDDDEKLTRKLYASGQNREMWTINESGLYNLIFRSNKPEAKAFRKWVTSEVLPAIRKTGGYQRPIIRYQPESRQQLSADFSALMYREIIKVESYRTRVRMAGLLDFYLSQLVQLP